MEDDLSQPQLLPALPEAEAKAQATSPDVNAAKFSLQQAGYETNIARYAWVPSFGLDFYYGIDANTFSIRTQRPGDSPRNNLGYSVVGTLNIPIVATLRDSQNYVRSAESGYGLAEMKANLVAEDWSDWQSMFEWLESPTYHRAQGGMASSARRR